MLLAIGIRAMKNERLGKLLDVTSTAERLGVSPFTIRAWLRQRRLLYVKLGRRVLVPEDAISRFIEANTVRARDEDGR
jgi:excisionase family DNA binding protein